MSAATHAAILEHSISALANARTTAEAAVAAATTAAAAATAAAEEAKKAIEIVHSTEQSLAAIIPSIKFKRVKKPALPNSYSSDDVIAMSDEELAHHFTRITGVTHLCCAHCSPREKPIYPYWVNSIRKRCIKMKGLTSEIKLPKTCDDQQKRNAISNPINNPAYAMLRSEPDTKTKNRVIKLRTEGLKKIGIATKPYRYVAAKAMPAATTEPSRAATTELMTEPSKTVSH
jgi:hypothetical protein